MLGNEPIFSIRAELEAITSLGRTPYGERRMIGIIGGTVSGLKLNGRVLPGGADWQIIRSDGAADIKARYTIETGAGALIMVTSEGLRHGPPEVMDKIAKGETVSPADYYLRIQPWFETASEKYAFLNRLLTVGIGHRLAAGPIYNVFEVI